ncbi:hypothetical protein [Burkholderia glumae]|uniref:hypothetical protein n=1 Tax=Burkholderia glumae TaxID=337 RepID=UPI0012967CCE|nr:hypothetical protein [Burkholderia glumae]MCM2540450.1 hypothetical protein [Burkholderia glumae]MCM2551988.1 hypothetical protein [Burkholderia glumae]MCQ0033054.1 hypothetical protein [Burkholderia glumae]MCQ0038088.1 hypothetical protein [Burkholderia glumae]MCR1767025.1 hypothetical protein [Burkholderia glumae]
MVGSPVNAPGASERKTPGCTAPHRVTAWPVGTPGRRGGGMGIMGGYGENGQRKTNGKNNQRQTK